MSDEDRYFEAIHQDLKLGGYFAVWPPGRPVELGAIGKLRGRVFDPGRHLEDYATVVSDKDDSQPDELTWGDRHGVDVDFAVDGQSGKVLQALTNVSLSVHLTFHEANQVALRAVGVRYAQVRDTKVFADSIIEAFRQGHVFYDEVFVNGMVTAESGAVVISADAGATVELTGKGDVAPGGTVSLASLKSSISISSSTKTSLGVPMSVGGVLAVRLVSLDSKGVFHKVPIVRDLQAFDADDVEFEREYVLTFDEAGPSSGAV